ncbi:MULTISPECIES: amino acid ABC transporter ATP-binding protein [Rhizobium/Agrobacterium group]|uniref:Amino acid ABC transporter ATP-binding protein n=3 Tax=Rhizobium TaxID=379 RepID=A0ABR5CKP4_9HYPH|nr:MULTISPECIES: ATP-binding cassette domain-containing protein [Rhizobium/Agrobacterium group]ACM30980.1 ABC transporter ATP-binding protein [Rhizobium rhizogenes K84]KJF65324.1 amino acid ABC transporter ATP-binding protein [Rhizobium nepotum 39/7]MQB08190.1 amino acid ABC transporter ATP-binding protein [Agrobacterium tumefaciens]NTH81470.1 amino acid ABC transporter ATP-binding protein [Rhizobium rhizogenes]NTH87447.1 amino acid ABC transporter ATP-binding protein [Rhizobium rhizogenes]
MIKVDKLSKSFGKTKVLHEIDLSVAHGEILCLVGQSGSGKSTLLRSLNLLELPDSGRIEINGQTYDGGARRDGRGILAVRRQTAMVFQSHFLFPDRTAADNIALGLRKVKRLSRTDAETKASAALAAVGLAGYEARYPAHLSGGQQQRVGIARATALEPAVVLMDEPTSALDPASVDEVLAVIRKLARQRVTMLIVTHEIQFALEIADRIVLMEGGRIRTTATPAEVRTGQAPEIGRFMRNTVTGSAQYDL